LYRWSPSKLIVVWESGGGCPRRKHLYPEYKANRGKIKAFSKKEGSIKDLLRDDEENKVKQLSMLYNLLKLTPVCQIFIKDTECDDIIGHLVKSVYQKEDCMKLIVSSDKDFYQLLEDDNVKIYDPARKIVIDQKYVLDKFNIHPRQICLARSIAGDPSDNIDGVPGVGLKTLAKRFKALQEPVKDLSIPDIIQEAKSILETHSKLKAIQDIVANEDIIKRNWKLMYLNSSNLAATQIQKINGTLDSHEPKLDKFGIMREVAKNGLNIPFDFNNFCNHLKQNLLFG
jgi:5'-3' exonuclease